jgi:ABC-2 type transport system permease protein
VSDEAIGTEQLRTVRGPSALGGGWRRFFDLLYLISVTDFKKTYFGTVLGYIWSLLRPLMLFAVLLFVFTKIFRLGSRVPHYPEMLLFNIVLFGFFQEATLKAVASVVGQEGIVRKTQFPRLVIPMATVLTSLFNLGTNLVAVFIFFLVFGVSPVWTWLLLPVIVAVLFVFTSALAMILSTLYVRFRDVAIIWSVIATALFYGTPVLYPFNVVPEQYQHLIALNPLALIFIQARHWIVDPSAPGAVASAGGFVHVLPAIAIYVTACVFSVWLFNHEAPRVAEEL